MGLLISSLRKIAAIFVWTPIVHNNGVAYNQENHEQEIGGQFGANENHIQPNFDENAANEDNIQQHFDENAADDDIQQNNPARGERPKKKKNPDPSYYGRKPKTLAADRPRRRSKELATMNLYMLLARPDTDEE